MALMMALTVVINTLTFLGVTRLYFEKRESPKEKKGETYFWQNIISYDHKKKGEKDD